MMMMWTNNGQEGSVLHWADASYLRPAWHACDTVFRFIDWVHRPRPICTLPTVYDASRASYY